MIVSALTEAHLAQDFPAEQYVTERGRNGATVQGFGLRLYASGRKTYVVRFGGQTVSLGDPSEVSLEEARRRAREKKAELAGGGGGGQGRRPLSWIASRHLERLSARVRAGDLAASTAAQYLALWRGVLLPRFGGVRLDRLSVAMVEEWKMAEADRAVFFNRALQQLSAALAYGVRLGWLRENPAAHVKPYGEHPSERVLSDEEIKSWSRALRKLEGEGRIPQAAAAALWTLFYSGARPGEVLRAKRDWLEVWYDNGTPQVGKLRLPRAKGDRPGRARGRVVRIPMPAVEKLLALPEGERLIPGVTSLRRPFEAVCREAGIEGASPKVLRHVWRSVAPEAGVDREFTRQLGGWSNHRVSDSVYAHERPALDEAAARIGEKLEEIAWTS